jgi:hypothetical protein
VNDLIDRKKRERGKLSRHNEVAKAMDYVLKRIDPGRLPSGHVASPAPPKPWTNSSNRARPNGACSND